MYERELTKDQFLTRAENICTTIGRETGLHYYVEKVHNENVFDIFLGRNHLAQSDSHMFIIGYLTGVLSVYRKENREGVNS